MSALLNMGIRPEPYDTTEIPYGEWLPDAPELNNPGALEALNVLPGEGGSYIPMCAHSPTAQIAPYTVTSAASVLLPNDVVQLYIGSSYGIHGAIGGGPVTSLWEGTSLDVNSWKFVRVAEQMVGIHPQYTTSKHTIGGLGAWSILGGSPPKAYTGAQVGDFLMLGNLTVDPDDGGNPFPSRVRWGGFNNIDAPWISDVATQADFQDMPAEGGPVTAITGREYATIFQARMISRATYRGLPQVFDIVTVEDKRGCIARDCVVDVGAWSFFIAEDGFFMWSGTNSTPIGDSRVNRYFFKRLQWSRRSRIVGAADFENGCVWWAFPTDSSGILNEIIIYSYRENRWSHSIQTLDYLVTSANSSTTLDSLTDSLESYTVSFDSPVYQQGGRQRVAAFNAQHAYGLYNGPSMAATLDTGEYSGPNSSRVMISHVRPLADISIPLITAQVISRNQVQGGGLEFSEPVGQEIDGTIPILDEARYMRFRTNIPAAQTWSHATGIEISRKAAGVF